MTQGMVDCVFTGGWLMGAIAFLILLLLAVSLGVLLFSGGGQRGRGDDMRQPPLQAEKE